MSQWRNISSEDRAVAYGLDRPVVVPPDGLITVSDDTDRSYDCQPAVWAKVGSVTAKPLSAVIAADEARLAADEAAAASGADSAS